MQYYLKGINDNKVLASQENDKNLHTHTHIQNNIGIVCELL